MADKKELNLDEMEKVNGGAEITVLYDNDLDDEDGGGSNLPPRHSIDEKIANKKKQSSPHSHFNSDIEE